MPARQTTQGKGYRLNESLPKLTRLRITYEKRDPLRFIGTLDMQRVWERTLRRAGLAVAYTQGFHPQPRLHLASPLILGAESSCEITDVWLIGESELLSLAKNIGHSAPEGLLFRHVETVALDSPNLQKMLNASRFRATPVNPETSTLSEEAVSQFLSSTTLPRERRGKTYDLRPLVLELILHNSPVSVEMLLAAREGATGRPDEVLCALDSDPNDFLIERTAILFQ